MSQCYLSIHPHSKKIPPSTKFLSCGLNWIGPVIPPLDIGRFSVC